MRLLDEAAHISNANLQVFSECPTQRQQQQQQQRSDPEVHSDTVGTPPDGASRLFPTRHPLASFMSLSWTFPLHMPIAALVQRSTAKSLRDKASL